MKNFICVLNNCLLLDLFLLSAQTSAAPLTNSNFQFREPGFLSTSGFNIPLQVSFTNVGATAKYSFNFVNPVGAPEGAAFDITFPSQFSAFPSASKDVVKIGPCGGQYLTLKTGASTFGCTVSGNTITITNFQRIESQKRTELYVDQVTNPNTAGPLQGAFTIQLKYSESFWLNANQNTTRTTLLAQNRIFPLITIKPAPTTNSATSSYTVSNLVAGQLADYTFSITGISGISYANTKYLNFVLQFTDSANLVQYPQLSRSFYVVQSTNGANTLTYRAQKLSDKSLLVTGIPSDPGWTSSTTPTFVIKNLRNPYQVQAAKAFTVKVLYQGNNYFLYSGSVTSSNSYTANTLTAVRTVEMSVGNKGAAGVTYNFRFNSPKQLVAADSASIVVTFPAQFSAPLESTFNSQVGLSFNLAVTRANPANAGTTGNFGITIKINGVEFAKKLDIPGVFIHDITVQTLTSPSVTALVGGNSFGVKGGIFEFQFTLPANLNLPPKNATNAPSIHIKFPYNVAATTGFSRVNGTIKLNNQLPTAPIIVGRAKGDTVSISEGGFLSSYIWNQTVVKIELNTNLNNPLQQYSSSNFEITMFETSKLQTGSGSGTFAVTFITSPLAAATSSVAVEVPSSGVTSHMRLNFKIPFPIVSGSTIKLIAVDTAGVMTWDANFGGQVNQQLDCYYERGLTGTCKFTRLGNKEISIAQYNAVTVYNQIVGILLPNIQNPTLSGSATARSANFTLQVLNSVNKVLETTDLFGIEIHPQNLLTLTPNPAISRVATTTPPGTLTYAGLNTGFKIKLQFTLPGTGMAAALANMKFGVPSELAFPQTALGCTAAYVNSTNNEVSLQPSPFCQNAFDNIVTVRSFPFQELASQATVQYRLYLIEMQNPNLVFTPASTTHYPFNLYASNWSLKYTNTNQLSYENLPVIQSQLENLKISLSSTAKSDFLVEYSFSFTMPQDVPNDSKVQIDFPSDFNTQLRLIGTSCQHSISLNSTHVTGSTCEYATRSFKFGAIYGQTIRKGFKVEIVIKHVINPANALATGITVKITNADGSVTYSNGASALSPTYTNAKTAGAVTVRQVNAQYLNAGNYPLVNYELEFKVTNQIPIYFISEPLIELSFPSTFNLGTTGSVYADCQVVYAPAVCTVGTPTNKLDITQIRVPISAGFILNVQIPKIATNPTAAGQTTSFTVTTKWGTTTTIDTTSGSASATKSYTSQAISSLTIGAILIEPVNYNTRALYTIPVTSGSAIIPSGAELELYFQESDYGILVADPAHFRCSIIGLSAASDTIKCVQREPASLIISNFAAIPATASFSILVYGIVKFQDTASTALSVSLKAVQNFLVLAEGTQTIARNVFQAGPDFVELLAISAASYETLETTDYTFQIKVENGLVATDQIGFIFPPVSYSFLTDQKFTCTSSQLTTSTSLSCVVRPDGHIYLSGFQALGGAQTISITIAKIRNPSNTGTVHGFMFKIQQNNKQLKYHSFPGSSQPNSLSFVSTKEPISLTTPAALYAGTKSSLFTFTLSSRVFQSFNVDITVSSSDSSVVVSKITPSATTLAISNGSDSVSFTLAIAADLALSDTYSYIYVDFTNRGPDSARFKPYTRSPPIRVYLATAQQAPISIMNAASVVKSTTSLPAYVTLSVAPVTDLTVGITSSVSGVTVSPTSVTLNAVTQQSFAISTASSVTESSVQLRFALSGTNANSYKVPSAVTVQIVASDSSTISFLFVNANTDYTSAVISVKPSKACRYYHEIKFSGIQSSVSALQALTPAVSDGSDIRIDASSLVAQTSYSLFIIGVGQNGVAPTSVSKFDFQTASRPASYRFTISFTRQQNDDNEKTGAQTALFAALSTMTFITNTRYGLLSFSFQFQAWNIVNSKAQITFFFVSDHFSSVNQITPADLKNQLSTTDGFNRLKSYYSGSLPLDALTSASIITIEQPEFGLTYPRIDVYYPDKIVLALDLNRAVTLYGVVLPISTTNLPNSNQVKHGLDGSGNAALVSGSLVVTSINTRYELSLESNSLQPRTRYSVFLYAEDPSQPSIVRFNSVVRFDTRTRTSIYPPDLYSALDGAETLLPKLWVTLTCAALLAYGAFF